MWSMWSGCLRGGIPIAIRSFVGFLIGLLGADRGSGRCSA
jgi:hypothetical protein